MKKTVVRRFRCGKVKFEKDVYQRKIEDAGKVHRAEDQKYIESMLLLSTQLTHHARSRSLGCRCELLRTQKIKVPSAENTELSKLLPCKAWSRSEYIQPTLRALLSGTILQTLLRHETYQPRVKKKEKKFRLDSVELGFI